MKRLPGKLAHESFEKLLPIDKIAIDPDTGSIDETSMAKLVEDFMAGPGKRAVEIPKEPKRMPTVPILDKTAKPQTDGEAKQALLGIMGRVK